MHVYPGPINEQSFAGPAALPPPADVSSVSSLLLCWNAWPQNSITPLPFGYTWPSASTGGRLPASFAWVVMVQEDPSLASGLHGQMEAKLSTGLGAQTITCKWQQQQLDCINFGIPVPSISSHLRVVPYCCTSHQLLFHLCRSLAICWNAQPH